MRYLPSTSRSLDPSGSAVPDEVPGGRSDGAVTVALVSTKERYESGSVA
jgi:hypothetical protein